MIVTMLGLSGLTNAYRSVLSATGSLAISGASRWEDITYLALGERSVACVEQSVCEARIAEHDFLRSREQADLAGREVANMGDDRFGHRARRHVRDRRLGGRRLGAADGERRRQARDGRDHAGRGDR